jgi:hypothetical protein
MPRSTPLPIPRETRDKKTGIYKADEYFVRRKAFIDYCIGNGMSYAAVGRILKISRHRVWQIYHYGNSVVTGSKVRAVRQRDGNRCKVCKVSGVRLEVHHIGSSTDHSESNLITVCSRCHKALERIKKLRAKRNKRSKPK